MGDRRGDGLSHERPEAVERPRAKVHFLRERGGTWTVEYYEHRHELAMNLTTLGLGQQSRPLMRKVAIAVAAVVVWTLQRFPDSTNEELSVRAVEGVEFFLHGEGRSTL